MDKFGKQSQATSRLICLTIATVGLLMIATVFRDADSQTTLTASSPALAGPTSCRSTAGATLQAEGLQVTGAETPASATPATAVQVLCRS
jgi:hypothetical protein